MEIGTVLQNLPPLVLRPDHEGVHGPLDVVPRLAALQLLLLVCSRGVLGHYYTNYRHSVLMVLIAKALVGAFSVIVKSSQTFV